MQRRPSGPTLSVNSAKKRVSRLTETEGSGRPSANRASRPSRSYTASTCINTPRTPITIMIVAYVEAELLKHSVSARASAR